MQWELLESRTLLAIDLVAAYDSLDAGVKLLWNSVPNATSMSVQRSVSNAAGSVGRDMSSMV